MSGVACILCAAGSSRRMGQNKLLLPFGESSVLGGVARELVQVPFCDIVAVTGFEHARVQSELAQWPSIRQVFNPRHATGLHSSIQAGLRALQGDVAAVLICLGDQPGLRAAHVKALLEAAKANPDRPLIYPVYEGQRGNPVLIHGRLRDEILAEPDSDRGCSYLFERYESLAVPMDNDAILWDVDTPTQYTQRRDQLNDR